MLTFDMSMERSQRYPLGNIAPPRAAVQANEESCSSETETFQKENVSGPNVEIQVLDQSSSEPASYVQNAITEPCESGSYHL